MLQYLEQFNPIRLPQLKERANLMRRTDNKYVLTKQHLKLFLQNQTACFDILCIDGLKQFQYSSAYLDSPKFDTFLDHNKGRRRRFKIRFRHYHETKLYFFEVKIKSFRNETVKYRTATNYQTYQQKTLPANLVNFANKKIKKHYGFILDYVLVPSVRVDYQRITLVAKERAERITIDNHIQFFSKNQKRCLSADFFVVEVKSTHGRSQVDRWLQRNGHRPVKRCSKYCMGLNLLKFPQKNTRFKPVLRRNFKKEFLLSPTVTV